MYIMSTQVYFLDSFRAWKVRNFDETYCTSLNISVGKQHHQSHEENTSIVQTYVSITANGLIL